MRYTVLVTGGTGFIGSQLTEELVKQKYTVIIPYVKIDKRSIFLAHKLDKKAELIKADVTNRKKVREIIQRYNVNFIFHLAAQTIVTEAYQNPYKTLHTNIMGTVNVLEASRSSRNIKGIVVASSDKAYGKTTKPYTENFPLAGDHPYDVSKSSADLIAQMYVKTYNLPVVVTRFGNVYGEGDLHFNRIVPGICEAIIKQKILEVRSSGTYVRDYVYVKDIVNGCMLLLKKINSTCGQAYNFSSRDTVSVIDLIKKIESILKIKVTYTILCKVHNEIPYQHLDDSKIKKLGWKNTFTMEDVMPGILSWYKNIL